MTKTKRPPPRGIKRTPPFRTVEEAILYRRTPKWQIWEALVHATAARTESDDLEMESGDDLTKKVRDELELFRNHYAGSK